MWGSVTNNCRTLARTGRIALDRKCHTHLFLPPSLLPSLPPSLSAAYDRFWEARKVWGSVTNDCRNLARTGRIALDRKYHARFSMLVIAFAVTLRAHLQRTVVSTELEALLPSWEADQVRMDSCPPALIAMKLTYLINEAVGKDAQRSDFYALYLEQLVGELINCLGKNKGGMWAGEREGARGMEKYRSGNTIMDKTFAISPPPPSLPPSPRHGRAHPAHTRPCLLLPTHLPLPLPLHTHLALRPRPRAGVLYSPCDWRDLLDALLNVSTLPPSLPPSLPRFSSSSSTSWSTSLLLRLARSAGPCFQCKEGGREEGGEGGRKEGGKCPIESSN